jgi:transcriptional regulator with XRE-family HTH domain
MPDPALAAVLRQLRERGGVTRETLAVHVGVTNGALARIELTQANPRWLTVRKLVDGLGVSLVELAQAVEAAERTSRAGDSVKHPRSLMDSMQRIVVLYALHPTAQRERVLAGLEPELVSAATRRLVRERVIVRRDDGTKPSRCTCQLHALGFIG